MYITIFAIFKIQKLWKNRKRKLIVCTARVIRKSFKRYTKEIGKKSDFAE